MTKINKKNHPEGLYALTFGEFWDRFSYFGTLTILVLYLSKIFNLHVVHAYLLYGVFVAFSFATPVLGGLLADKVLGSYNAIIVGAIFMIGGNLVLMNQSLELFYLGLSLTICGTGLYKSSCTSMVGMLYQKDDARRTQGFTIFYAGMNLGAVLGPVVYGIILKLFGWHYIFISSAIGIFIGLLITLHRLRPLQRLLYQPKIVASFKSLLAKYLFVFSIVAMILVLSTLAITVFIYPELFTIFIALFSILAPLAITAVAAKQDYVTKRSLYGVLILTAFCVLFFSVSLQIGSTVTMFLQQHANRNLFGWHIPTVMFSSLDPLFVVLAAPVFSIIWLRLAIKKLEPSPTKKLSIGLALGGISFLVFMLLSTIPNASAVMTVTLIIIANLFLGAGEICLTPAILSAISEYVPKNLQATMMGIWFLALALAGYLSGVIAEGAESLQKLLDVSNVHGFSYLFLLVGCCALALSIIIFVASSTVQKLFEVR
ncbi:MAG: peptide MFS transporter [Gammaproteobacteria bacterium]|nr:peptide MFS transporter [Gammaproteobacteria bacterium]